MAVANYSTTMSPERSMDEIRKMLRKWEATEIAESYANGKIVGLHFIIKNRQYSIAVNPAQVLKRLELDTDVRRSFCTMEQAQRVTWRLLANWIKYQIEVANSGLFEREMLLLPHHVSDIGVTVWEAYRNSPALEDHHV